MVVIKSEMGCILVAVVDLRDDIRLTKFADCSGNKGVAVIMASS